MSNFGALPAELLHIIFQYVSRGADIASLSRVSHRFDLLATPILQARYASEQTSGHWGRSTNATDVHGLYDLLAAVLVRTVAGNEVKTLRVVGHAGMACENTLIDEDELNRRLDEAVILRSITQSGFEDEAQWRECLQQGHEEILLALLIPRLLQLEELTIFYDPVHPTGFLSEALYRCPQLTSSLRRISLTSFHPRIGFHLRHLFGWLNYPNLKVINVHMMYTGPGKQSLTQSFSDLARRLTGTTNTVEELHIQQCRLAPGELENLLRLFPALKVLRYLGIDPRMLTHATQGADEYEDFVPACFGHAIACSKDTLQRLEVITRMKPNNRALSSETHVAGVEVSPQQWALIGSFSTYASLKVLKIQVELLLGSDPGNLACQLRDCLPSCLEKLGLMSFHGHALNEIYLGEVLDLVLHHAEVTPRLEHIDLTNSITAVEGTAVMAELKAACDEARITLGRIPEGNRTWHMSHPWY